MHQTVELTRASSTRRHQGWRWAFGGAAFVLAVLILLATAGTILADSSAESQAEPAAEPVAEPAATPAAEPAAVQAAEPAAVPVVEPGTATSPAMPIFDPDKTVGGTDIWRADRLPDGTFATPVNLGPNVNSSRRETSPAISPDGRYLYFAGRTRAGGLGKEDLYVSEWQGDGWGPAVNMGLPINSASEEIGPCIMPDGITLLFSRRDVVQRAYDLMISVKVEGEWLDPIPYGEPLYTPSEECLASVTADGQELYFAALRKSGFGSYDLLVSYKDDEGRWGEPSNLGPRINSSESDYSPGISPDGQRLYFSSQRDEIGNFDIYVCERTASGAWGAPERLPAPINSRMTEYCPFVARDGSLYFASDRRRGAIEISTEVDE